MKHKVLLILIIVIALALAFMIMQPDSLTRICDAWNVEKEYFENGVVKTATLTMPEEDLKCTHSYYPTGRLYKKYCRDLSGKLQGLFKEFYENGNTKEISSATNDKIEGLSRTYYETGSLKDSFYFSNGLKDGFLISYYINGDIEAINYFENDILTHKKVFLYDSIGNPSIYETYNPIVSLSRDTINYGDTLTVTFTLPLDKTYKDYEKHLRLRFDFQEIMEGDTLLLYPSITDSIIGKLERRFVIEDDGDHIVYGFLEGHSKDSTVQYESFEKRFYVRGN